MELIGSVPVKPLPMQILALANNAGEANQVSRYRVAVESVLYLVPYLVCMLVKQFIDVHALCSI